MANIFKTTLKKDVIADIANGKREVRFPVTKFWATRFAEKYNLDKKEFIFKIFDSLEFSSPSNKETGGETYVFDFDRTFVDGEEFVVIFKDSYGESLESCQNDDNQVEIENVIPEYISEVNFTNEHPEQDVLEDSDINYIDFNLVDEDENDEITFNDIFKLTKQWFDEKNILETLYEDEDVIATNARQVIVLPNGKVLGNKKTLPVNNDVEVRIEFDKSEKVYFETTFDFDVFEEDILRILSEIRKNNFVFIWKRYTGIFMDSDGVYFGIKYSTRRSIGFNRKYNVQ